MSLLNWTEQDKNSTEHRAPKKSGQKRAPAGESEREEKMRMRGGDKKRKVRERERGKRRRKSR